MNPFVSRFLVQCQYYNNTNIDNILIQASKLLVLILQSLKEENRLRRHYLELLITPQLEHLDLSRESEDVSYPLQLAVTRCVVIPVPYSI